MRTLSRVMALLVAGVVISAIPACGKNGGGSGGSTSTKKTKVAVVSNCTAEFWSIAEAGAMKASKDFDVDVVFRQPKSNTVVDQMDIVNDLVRVGVSGLAVSVNNPDEQTPALQGIAGKVNLIYIDPPFDTGADFSFNATICSVPEEGDDDGSNFTKQPSIIEQKA